MAIQFVYHIYLYITVCIHSFNMVMRYGLDAVGVCLRSMVGVCRVRWLAYSNCSAGGGGNSGILQLVIFYVYITA